MTSLTSCHPVWLNDGMIKRTTTGFHQYRDILITKTSNGQYLYLVDSEVYVNGTLSRNERLRVKFSTLKGCKSAIDAEIERVGIGTTTEQTESSTTTFTRWVKTGRVFSRLEVVVR